MSFDFAKQTKWEQTTIIYNYYSFHCDFEKLLQTHKYKHAHTRVRVCFAARKYFNLCMYACIVWKKKDIFKLNY